MRYVAPFSFAPSRSTLTAVFATLEQQAIRKHQLADPAEWEALRRVPPPPNVKVITPSNWSAEGFYKAGFGRDQVVVVPHGVDTGSFRRVPQAREQARRQHGLEEGDFVFLSIGAMSGNKGIDLLLRAFAKVSSRFPRQSWCSREWTRLANSRRLVAKWTGAFPARDQQGISGKVVYLGQSLSCKEMASFYQIGDVYVSPYRAEGFNMPVLEAAACGLPVICTRGGSTNDFVSNT